MKPGRINVDVGVGYSACDFLRAGPPCRPLTLESHARQLMRRGSNLVCVPRGSAGAWRPSERCRVTRRKRPCAVSLINRSLTDAAQLRHGTRIRDGSHNCSLRRLLHRLGGRSWLRDDLVGSRGRGLGRVDELRPASTSPMKADGHDDTIAQLPMSPILKERHPPVLVIPLDVKLALERLKLAEVVRQQGTLPFPSPLPVQHHWQSAMSESINKRLDTSQPTLTFCL